MKTRLLQAIAGLLSLLVVAGFSFGVTTGQEAEPLSPDAAAATLGGGFTYQGTFSDAGVPANGTYDFQFRLHTAAAGGSPSAPLVVENVTVTNGHFTTTVDFGSGPFSGQARWLEVGVRPGDSDGVFTVLSPRQPLTAVPYALGLRPGARIFGSRSGALLTLNNSDNDLASGLEVSISGSQGFAVYASADTRQATIRAENVATVDDSDAIQAIARSFFGEAVEAINSADSGAIIFLGCRDTACSDRKFVVRNDGNVSADGSFTGGGADYADMLAVSGKVADYAPGDVLVIDADGRVKRSHAPNAANVAGVYSTAPAFVGDPLGIPTETEEVGGSERVPVALAGVVPTNVSDENGPIRPGDLLTTASLPGHAMKASPLTVDGVTFFAPGTLIGKALGTLDSGAGVINVLVTLQ